MASPVDNVPLQPSVSREAEVPDQKRLSKLSSKWFKTFMRRDNQVPCLGEKQQTDPPAPGFGIGKRFSRRVVPGLPRPQTFRRQNSERRDRLQPVEPSFVERRTVSVDRRRAMSACSTSPHLVDTPKLSAPAVFGLGHEEFSQRTQDMQPNGGPHTTEPFQVRRPAPPPSPPSERDIPETGSQASIDSLDGKIRTELEEKWILNLSMHFRDKSPREKFFVTYAETATRWRRVTISVDYRDAPADSLERDLQGLDYQRDKSERIYEAIRASLPDIQFYDTVTNLKLETTRDERLHVHVTEDTNEIINYPSTHMVQHLDCPRISESDVHFQSHMSGFVYKVKVNGHICVKKEIPGPDSVEEFLYEINALHALVGSRNVIQFRGLVVDGRENLVKGLLISFAEQGPLVDILFDFKTTLEWAKREEWAKQIVHGLSEIHEAGFVQGDFTLSNIVIDENETAQIIDINRRGCPVGWEPPEIAKLIASGQRISMSIGVKSDLFQLGMVLWALAEEEDEPERQVRPLSLMDNMKVPEYFRRLTDICLSPSPRDRLAAKDLLTRFPSLPTDSDNAPPSRISPLVGGSHDFSNIPENHRDLLDDEDFGHSHHYHASRDASIDSRRRISRRNSIDLPFDGHGSYMVSRRGRTPPLNTAHLDPHVAYSYGLDDRDVSSEPDDAEAPQIVPISPGEDHRWEEIQIDGRGFIVQRNSTESVGDDDTRNDILQQRSRSRQRLSDRILEEDGEGGPVRHVPLSMEHVDSGLADMDIGTRLAYIGGHDNLASCEPAEEESEDLDISPKNTTNDSTVIDENPAPEAVSAPP